MDCARKKRKKRLIKFGIVLIIGFLASYIYGKICVNPIIKEISKEKMKNLATIAINDAVLESIKDTPEFADMVAVTYDNENNVKNITVKSYIINKLVQSTAILAQEKIAEMGVKGINIPYGTLSGVTFLSGKGPSVNLQVVPVGSVETELRTEFTECGINQTYHKIYMKVKAKTSILIPGVSSMVESATDVLIFNSIIVGKIPETYLKSTSVQDMLDLIP